MRRKIGLQGCNGKFVYADKGGGGWIYARGAEILQWDTWEVIDRGNGKVALKCMSGQLMCATEGGGSEVTASR